LKEKLRSWNLCQRLFHKDEGGGVRERVEHGSTVVQIFGRNFLRLFDNRCASMREASQSLTFVGAMMMKSGLTFIAVGAKVLVQVVQMAGGLPAPKLFWSD